MFDQIMRLASANAYRQMESLEAVSLNVANINTTGYKAKRFEQFLTTDERLDGVTRIDTSQGNQAVTRRDLDIAVDGFGYLPVTQPDGTIAYTRDGSMTVNNQGYLVTQRGDLVGEGIKLPADYKKIRIKTDGDVQVQTIKENNYTSIGKISLVRFINPEGLTNIGYNKLQASEQSGGPLADTESQIRQGMLERANVNVYGQIEQILRLNAAMISNMRIIKFTDDLYRQSVNLKQ